MADHISLRYERPAQHYVTDLAPRVMGRPPYQGRYGYALCLTGAGKVRVLWDDDGDDPLMPDIHPAYLIFIESRSTS